MRNPKWHRDEIILALDLYFQPGRGTLDSSNPKIIALSKLLNKLPIFPTKPDEERFRNPNGVTLKLSNFLPFDSSYNGKGMTRGSKLDAQIFNEFVDRKDELRTIAAGIKELIENDIARDAISVVEDDEQTYNESVTEGTTLYKYHKVLERNKSIILQKKKVTLDKYGKLACEACGFDFNIKYGDAGRGFIECHHKVPLAQIKSSRKTSLDDLALLCANCHRVIHRNINTLSIQDLKSILSR